MKPEAHDLEAIKWLVDQNDTASAGNALKLYMSDFPDDPRSAYLCGHVLNTTGNPALARIVFEWLEGRVPEAQRRIQLGKSWDCLGNLDAAADAYRSALELVPDDPGVLQALAASVVGTHDNEQALALTARALESDPDNARANYTRAFALLNQRMYGEGWDRFEYGVGTAHWRGKKCFQGEPYWDGSPGKRLIIYSEQGLGDQIAGVEPLRDVMKDNEVVLLECTRKLRGLFERSFGVTVESVDEWSFEPVDASAIMFSMHRHYRRSAEAYPGTPYLIADPVRRAGWRAILDGLGDKPKVGIAWSGGTTMTQRKERRETLQQLLPILSQDCEFISLEYRDRDDEIEAFARETGKVIHNYPWATRTDDYDDTAALVAELDMVIAVPTSVVHLAGALGVETHCMVHSRPNIHYGTTGDIPYFDCVHLYRGDSRIWQVASVLEQLAEAA